MKKLNKSEKRSTDLIVKVSDSSSELIQRLEKIIEKDLDKKSKTSQ